MAEDVTFSQSEMTALADKLDGLDLSENERAALNVLVGLGAEAAADADEVSGFAAGMPLSFSPGRVPLGGSSLRESYSGKGPGSIAGGPGPVEAVGVGVGVGFGGPSVSVSWSQ
jgi:hypothetical protein